MKKAPSFNTPFQQLKGVTVPEKTLSPQTSPPEPPPPPSEDELFAQAMQGVLPMPQDRVAPEPEEPQARLRSMRQQLRSEDQEVLDALDALVQGRARFDITATGEYVEGHVASIDPVVMQRLKDGTFAIQDHIDLHGLTRAQALHALDTFFQNATALGDRCLLIIHGRGLKSPEGPVLKEAVISWLTTGRRSHLVLALCSARACDGGTGALYVLLRKRPQKSVWKRP